MLQADLSSDTNIPQELISWHRIWPKLAIFLPKLKQSMSSFYFKQRRYRGLKQVLRELQKQETSASSIWRCYNVWDRNIYSFANNFIKPMCFLMNASETNEFVAEFVTYFQTLLSRSNYKQTTVANMLQAHQKIEELFDFGAIVDLEKPAPTARLSTVVLCNIQEIRQEFEPDPQDLLPSLSFLESTNNNK